MADERLRPDIAQLVAEHHQAVYRYAYRLSGSIHDAEDLTQEAFLAAQRNLGQIRNVDSAKSWMFAILRNCFLKDRQRRRLILAGDSEFRIDSVAAPQKKDESDHDRLQAALDWLPENHRVALVMFFFEDCSYREIAERLEIPIGTVMSRMARARAQLKTILLEPEKAAVQE
jgi:RNA polymerase sigma-70 factor (ECF subfamily)